MSELRQVHVYHHTHWDREWWTTMQDFRIRLVELIDELLETLDQDPEFRCFLLDGQTIVLKDYLEIRPENRARLVSYIQNKRIQCGPWYILPDEFLVSGEAHIRNLWLGEFMARKLKIENEKVGYIPDTFGHISQMPQILQGFEIDNALLWRGFGGSVEQVKQEFRWESPDGTGVFAYWFPDGYYVVDFLHFDNPEKTYDETYGRVKRSIERWIPRATTNHLLMPYGGDHRKIDSRLPRLLKSVNKEFEGYACFRWATVQEYLDAVREENPEVATVKGELRYSGEELPHLLPGVLSARMYLKQRNFAVQNRLTRYAEPFAAMAWKLGKKYENTLLWTAWELLVQNHPHDSICGCSIDQVHREMLPRFDQSEQIAQIITEKSAQFINGKIDTSCLADNSLALVAYNSLSWRRSGLTHEWLDQKLHIHPRTHLLVDDTGKEVPFEVKDVEGLKMGNEHSKFIEITFLSADVPALGYRAHQLSPREAALDPKMMFFNAVLPKAKLKGSDDRTDLRVGSNVLENKYLQIAVQEDGTLQITDKQSGQVYTGLNAFEDGGDAGDEYNYAAPLNDTVCRSSRDAKVHVSLDSSGYASATLRIDLDWALPCALSADRLSRSSDYADVRISTFVTLAAESCVAAVKTVWDNPCRDHRLRALFPLGEALESSVAEAHFDVIERQVLNPSEKGRGWPELPVKEYPQQGYLSICKGSKGLTIANKGLTEYEVHSDDEGTAAISLLRAVGWVSREDTLVREGGAGPATRSPDAQCLGMNVAEYAIIPHSGDWLSAKSYMNAHEYLAPIYGSVTDRHSGVLPYSGGMLDMSEDHTLMLSAIKRSEDGNAMILRFWNVAKSDTEAVLTFKDKPISVQRVNLKEKALNTEPYPLLPDGSFTLKAGPAEMVTIAVNFED